MNRCVDTLICSVGMRTLLPCHMYSSTTFRYSQQHVVRCRSPALGVEQGQQEKRVRWGSPVYGAQQDSIGWPKHNSGAESTHIYSFVIQAIQLFSEDTKHPKQGEAWSNIFAIDLFVSALGFEILIGTCILHADCRLSSLILSQITVHDSFIKQ